MRRQVTLPDPSHESSALLIDFARGQWSAASRFTTAIPTDCDEAAQAHFNELVEYLRTHGWPIVAQDDIAAIGNFSDGFDAREYLLTQIANRRAWRTWARTASTRAITANVLAHASRFEPVTDEIEGEAAA